MRNLKKFLALVLAMLMVFSMAVITTGAADEADYSDAAHHLAALKILKGDENGNLNLDNGVTRWQAALFFVQALTGKTDAKVWNADKSVYFTDVPEYGTAIDYAYGINLIVGRGNGTYGYQDAITYQDMLVMAVRALGYETDNMVYPSGYTMAAEKLGLTENIDVSVSWRDALTRGETAQIIWDMLNVPVAYTDPLTGDIIYPEDTGIFEILMNANKKEGEEPFKVTRTTLLEESGFADDELVGTVVEFIEADEDVNDYEEDMVVVATDNAEYTLVAADLGITADTLPTTYLGLPVTLYIDCDLDDFTDKYADDEATIVFAKYADYTVVENLGDEGNIKVVVNADNMDKTYVSLGGTKFVNKNYYVQLKVWNDTNKIWEDASDAVLANAFASFVYDDGEYVGADGNYYVENWKATADNTYAKVAYRVTDETVEADGYEKIVVEALYTPYAFGQYNVLEIKDAEYATYTDGFNASMKLFGTNKTVTKNTASVSTTNGAYAKDVTLAGEEIESGDFMFYAYNKADNVLTVAKNCGTFETGRMTGYSGSKETAKISGTSYAFGFDGIFAATGETAYDKDEILTYINKLEAGKNNVKYLAVDNKLVFVTEPDAEEAEAVGAYEFVIATTEAAVVAELLELDVDDYVEALADGQVYVDENGYVAVAVLDTATGEWKLASLKSLALTYDEAEEKFTDTVDVATYAEFAEIGKLADDVVAKYNAAVAALNGRIFALISEKDGVYALGAATTYAAEAAEPEVVENPGDAPAVVADPGDAPAEVAKPDNYDSLAVDDPAKVAYDNYVAAKAQYDTDKAAYDAYVAAKAAYDTAKAAYDQYLLDVEEWENAVDAVDAYAPFATAPATKGIIFNTTGRTNPLAVPGSEDDDGVLSETRITMAADTVVVALFSDGVIGVRVGATKNDGNNVYDVKGGNNSVFFAVSDKLIVLDTEKASSTLSMEFDVWSTSNIVGSTDYYVVLADSEVETDVNDDNETVYTVTNVFSVRGKKVVDITSTNNIGDVIPGDILYLRSTGSIDASSALKKNTSAFNDGDKYDGGYKSHLTFQGAIQGIYFFATTRTEAPFVDSDTKFVDGETMRLVSGNNNTEKWALTKNITSLTGNANTFNYFGLYGDNAGLDQADYDFESMVLATPIARYEDIENAIETDEYYAYAKAGHELIQLSDEEVALYVDGAVEGQEYYFVAYALTTELYESFSEPTEGVFNQFMIDNNGAKLLVPAADSDDYTDVEEVYISISMSTYISGTTVKLAVTNLLVDRLSDLYCGYVSTSSNTVVKW